MIEGVEEPAKAIAGLVLQMPEADAVRTLANMEYFVRACVLHVIERDRSPATAEAYRAGIVQLGTTRKPAINPAALPLAVGLASLSGGVEDRTAGGSIANAREAIAGASQLREQIAATGGGHK